jgi:hypothetical protein
VHTHVDAATTSASALLRTLQSSPLSLLTTASGSLGWGMGAALDLQFGAPDRQAIAGVDIAVVARGFGLPARRLTRAETPVTSSSSEPARPVISMPGFARISRRRAGSLVATFTASPPAWRIHVMRPGRIRE